MSPGGSSSPPRQRQFIAIALPPAVREAVAAQSQPIHGLAWTRPEQMHLTLRFLGEVGAEQRERLVERLASVRVEPFILPLDGLGTFPPNGAPRVVWLGVGSGHPRLFQLRQRVDDAVLAAGIDVELRSFHPHVTLARGAGSASPALSHWLHARRDYAAPPFRVEAFGLYVSVLQPGGAVHMLRHPFPLRAGGRS